MTLHNLVTSWAYITALLLSGAVFAQSAANVGSSSSAVATELDRSTLAVQSLQSWYELETGLYKTTGWWNSANVITTVANYAKSQQTHEYDFVFSNTLSAAEKKFPGFINEYYDDEGWWALAWIDVYQHTHDPRYLDAAKFIFRDMTYGWNDTCSGGIWWSKDRKYKNAIANELFLSVSAKLATETKDVKEQREYLHWAHREWRWFSQSGMINSEGLVNDGLTATCVNNQQTTWSYNQGVVLGGLTSLARLDHDPALLAAANRIAHAAISRLTDNQGILHDRCEPKCGADGTQFKGIFVRNLQELAESTPQPQYGKFIRANAASIWNQVKVPDYRLGQAWAPPYGAADASTQSSALDVLVAATVTKPKRR